MLSLLIIRGRIILSRLLQNNDNDVHEVNVCPAHVLYKVTGGSRFCYHVRKRENGESEESEEKTFEKYQPTRTCVVYHRQ